MRTFLTALALVVASASFMGCHDKTTTEKNALTGSTTTVHTAD